MNHLILNQDDMMGLVNTIQQQDCNGIKFSNQVIYLEDLQSLIARSKTIAIDPNDDDNDWHLFKHTLGDSYDLHSLSKHVSFDHESIHKIIKEHEGTEVADLLASLIWRISLTGNRNSMLRAKLGMDADKVSQKQSAIEKAVHAAVAAVYFNDNSDYVSALHEVVKILDPAMSETLLNNERQAYEASLARTGE